MCFISLQAQEGAKALERYKFYSLLQWKGTSEEEEGRNRLCYE